MDLVTFLREMLDRDEQAARLVENGPGEVLRRGLDPLRVSDGDGVRYSFLTVDPARVQAEIGAKRQRIKDYLKVCEDADPTKHPEQAYVLVKGALERTLMLDALPYADDPGYQEKWRP